MNSLNVKTGDKVVVLTGKDKGKVSTVKATSPKTSRVVVEGVNIQTKHMKARNTKQKSQIIKQEGAIDASNVMVVCPACDKATRIAKKEVEGKNVRICKKCGAVLDTEKKVVKAKKEKTAKTTTKPAKEKTTKASTKTTAPKATQAKSTTKRVVKSGDR